MIPNIEQKDGIWRGKIILESWNSFFNLNNDIELNVGGDVFVETLEEKHIVAYDYLEFNQNAILKNILNNLLEKYPEMQKEYGYDKNERNKYMPDVSSIIEFSNLLMPKRIYILDVEYQGIAYIGFQFDCLWDEEQQFGVMMYKNNVIKMDGADAAFLSWIAEDDKNMKNKQI